MNRVKRLGSVVMLPLLVIVGCTPSALDAEGVAGPPQGNEVDEVAESVTPAPSQCPLVYTDAPAARSAVDCPFYGSLAEQVGVSVVIVIGTVESWRADLYFPHLSTTDGDAMSNAYFGCDLTEEELVDLALEMALPMVISTIRVSRVFKGDVAVGDTIEIAESGGYFDGYRILAEHGSFLNENTDPMLLFLMQSSGDWNVLIPLCGVGVTTWPQSELEAWPYLDDIEAEVARQSG